MLLSDWVSLTLSSSNFAVIYTYLLWKEWSNLSLRNSWLFRVWVYLFKDWSWMWQCNITRMLIAFHFWLWWDCLPLLIHISFTTRVHLDFPLIGLALKIGKTIMFTTLTWILTSKSLAMNPFIGLHLLPSFFHLSLHWSLWYVGLILRQALLRTPGLIHSF